MLFPAQRYKKLQNGESRMKIYSLYFLDFSFFIFYFSFFCRNFAAQKEKRSEKTAHLCITCPALARGCRSLQVGTLLQLRIDANEK